jgi:hypothetical protein
METGLLATSQQSITSSIITYNKIKYGATEIISDNRDRELNTTSTGWTSGGSALPANGWTLTAGVLNRAAGATLSSVVHTASVVIGKTYQIWLTVGNPSSTVHQFGIGGVLVNLPSAVNTVATATIVATSTEGFKISSTEPTNIGHYMQPYAREVLSNTNVSETDPVSFTEDLISDWNVNNCFTDAAKTVPCVNGSRIYTVADPISGFDVAQSVVGARFQFVSTVDGYKSIRADTAFATYMTSSFTSGKSNGSWPAPCTIYVIGRNYLPFNGTTWPNILGSASASVGLGSINITNSAGSFGATQGPGLGSSISCALVNHDSEWRIVAAVFNAGGTRIDVYNKNGLIDTVVPVANTWGLGSLSGMLFGHSFQGADMDISRICIYSRAHSKYEVSQIVKQFKFNFSSQYKTVPIVSSKNFTIGTGTTYLIRDDIAYYCTGFSRTPDTNSNIYFLGTKASANGAGECTPVNTPVDSLNFWSYNTVTSKFTSLTSPAGSLFTTTSATACSGMGLVSSGGFVHAFGGWAGGAGNKKVLTYNSSSATWTNGVYTDFPVVPTQLGDDAVLIGNIAYVYNGADKKIYSINLTTPPSSWSTGSTANVSGSGVDTVVSDGTYIYVIGNTAIPGVNRFNPSNSTWTAITNTPTSSFGAAATYVAPYIYVFGPKAINYSLLGTDVIWKYDTTGGSTTNPWVSVSLLPFPWSHGHAMYDGTNIILMNGASRSAPASTHLMHTSAFKFAPP